MAEPQDLAAPPQLGLLSDSSSRAPTIAEKASTGGRESSRASVSMSERTLEHKDLEAGEKQRTAADDEWTDDTAAPEVRGREEDVEKAMPPPSNPPAATNGPPPAEKDPNIVEWDGPDDPENPQNWPRWRRWLITTVLSGSTFCVTFASSVFSTATQVTAVEFGTSNEVMILGTALFVLGYVLGPLIWGPMSEVYGRKNPMFIGVAVMGIFQIPVAVAQNIETIMVCRFIQGVFGCSPLSIVGGQLADVWDPVDRGVAIVTFAAATFIGPVAGPIVGGFLVDSYLGWRWTQWITLIMVAFFGILGYIIVPETFAPVLLSRRAKNLRFATKNWALHAKHDESRVDFNRIVTVYLVRPIVMLFTEPILLLMTIYMALIYGILYMFFEAFPITFQEQRGWNDGVGALPFLSLIVGVVVGGTIIIWATKTRFARKMKKHGRVVPEERLPPMIVGSIMLPVGLFWFAWTSDPSLPWAPQVVAGVPIGAGILMIFMQGINYIIDVYLMYANSAVAGNTIVRSLLGAGFPLFANYMYSDLGVAWATSLLAFLTVAMIPIPVAFYFYGKRIRGWSKMSPSWSK